MVGLAYNELNCPDFKKTTSPRCKSLSKPPTTAPGIAQLCPVMADWPLERSIFVPFKYLPWREVLAHFSHCMGMASSFVHCFPPQWDSKFMAQTLPRYVHAFGLLPPSNLLGSFTTFLPLLLDCFCLPLTLASCLQNCFN